MYGIYCVYNNIDKYISNHFPTVREVTHSITTCTQHYKEKTKQSKKQNKKRKQKQKQKQKQKDKTKIKRQNKKTM